MVLTILIFSTWKGAKRHPEFQITKGAPEKQNAPSIQKGEIYLLVMGGGGGCLDAKVAFEQSHESDAALSSVYIISSQFLATSTSLQISTRTILRIIFKPKLKRRNCFYVGWVGSQHAEPIVEQMRVEVQSSGKF